MKRRMCWNWKLGLALAVLPFLGGYPQDSYSQPTDPIAEAETEATSEEAATATPASAEAAAAEEDVVNAPVKPITTAHPLPPGIQPTGPVAEILRLVDSAVDESVLMAFVTNSTRPFRLDAEQIIFLNDIGIPSTVVTAMIQRDQALKFSTNAVAVAAAPAPVAPAPAPVEAPPAPAEMAPQPDLSAGAYAAAGDSTYAPFYDSLAPYGTWVDVDGYGACWQPTVVVINSGWRPYCDGGRWIYTDCGWYWLSGYSWGWAPFHYGRWFRHGHYGWCWQPGTTWGPSWVGWRYSGSYCGWAPLPPAAGFSVGFGLTYHGQHVNSGFGFGLGVGAYTFVPMSHFSDHHPQRYALSHQDAAQVYHQTVPSATIASHGTRVVNRGIPVSRVETAARTQLPKVSVREGSTPHAPGARGERFEGRTGTVSSFRPHFPQSTGAQPASRGRTEIRPNGSSTPALSPVRRTSEPAQRRADPMILRGADRSHETGAGAASRPAPANSLIVIGRKDSARSQTTPQTASSATQTARTPAAVPQQNIFSRPTTTSRPQPAVTATANARSPQSWSIPRRNESSLRVERPREIQVPAASAPVQVPRNDPQPTSSRQEIWSRPAPMPSPVPRETRTFSAPVQAPAPRAAAPEARSAPSAPSRSFSPPASSSQPSSPFSGRSGR